MLAGKVEVGLIRSNPEQIACQKVSRSVARGELKLRPARHILGCCGHPVGLSLTGTGDALEEVDGLGVA
jgi:hypothetical protein